MQSAFLNNNLVKDSFEFTDRGEIENKWKIKMKMYFQ